MAKYALELEAVSKTFRRGELSNSLRDFLPALAQRLFRPRRVEAGDRREFWALRDVSFGVEHGEAFGIVGGNGAGKSTILKLLTGIMRPTKGSIRADGRVSALIEVSAGFHQDLTGRENIYLNGAILGMTRDQIRSRFDAIVAFSGLEEFIDTPVKRYSSGMYARLGFSVAAHVDPDVLLVDEVLSVGDYLFQRKCVEHMNSVIANGATVIFVSHNLRAVANLCKRSLLLDRGEVKMIGPTSDIIRTYYLRGQEQRIQSANSENAYATINSVSIHDGRSPCVEFVSGEKMYVTIAVQARTRLDDLSVVMQIVDENQYPLFDTCTQRLGAGPISLDEGHGLTCTFQVNLSLAQGTFYVNAYLHRYVTDRPYDRWLAANTFFVTGVPEVRGAVNLHPKLVAIDLTDSIDVIVNRKEESSLQQLAGANSNEA